MLYSGLLLTKGGQKTHELNSSPGKRTAVNTWIYLGKWCKREMQKKLDKILDTVMDRQINAPISQTGLVERFRYVPNKQKLIVVCRHPQSGHACCIVLNETVFAQTLEELKSALKTAFPHLRIEMVF